MRAHVKRFSAAVRGAVDLRDVFVFGGLGLAFYGLAQWDIGLACSVIGAVIFWLGVRR